MSESACSYGRESRSHALLREELRRDLIGRDKQLIRGIFGNEGSCMILLNSCVKVFRNGGSSIIVPSYLLFCKISMQYMYKMYLLLTFLD
jgi:hypothetical protein